MTATLFSGKSLSLCPREGAPWKTLCPKCNLMSQIVPDLQLLLRHKTGNRANISKPKIQQKWGFCCKDLPETASERMITRGSCGPVFGVTGVWDDAQENCHLFHRCPQGQVSFRPLKRKIQHLIVFSVFHPERCSALSQHFICGLKTVFVLHSVL